MSITPDVAARRVAIREGIFRGQRTVGIDAHDLPQVRLEIRGRIESHAVAGGDEQFPVGRKDETWPEVTAACGFRHLPPDHLQVPQRIPIESRTRNGGPANDAVTVI